MYLISVSLVLGELYDKSFELFPQQFSVVINKVYKQLVILLNRVLTEINI